MQRHLFLLCIFFISLASFAQDSVRVTLCESGGPECFSGPRSLYKTIDYYDSTGYLYKSSYYNFQRCDADYADTAFLHTSDVYYTYDTSGNVLSEEQFNFEADTVSYHWLLTWTYDSSGHELIQRTILLYPQVQPSLYDSTAYDQAGYPVYKIRQTWNSDVSDLDTTGIQLWMYDSLEREIESDYYFYSNFIFLQTNHTYTEYDTASNIISVTNSNSRTLDSNQDLTVYDAFNRKTETWNQGWDTVSGSWQKNGRETFEYDSLHLLTKYVFYCSDSLCTDSASKSEYSYDVAGHLTSVNNYV